MLRFVFDSDADADTDADTDACEEGSRPGSSIFLTISARHVVDEAAARAAERHGVGRILTLPPQGRGTDVLVAHSQSTSNGDEDIASPIQFQSRGSDVLVAFAMSFPGR
jgi:hypothetical protein